MKLTFDYLNRLISEIAAPEPVFNKHGDKIKHEFFELPMSDEAVALAVTQGWKRKTVYRKDPKTKKLVPRTTFTIPATISK
jgi:hypothetical protein